MTSSSNIGVPPEDVQPRETSPSRVGDWVGFITFVTLAGETVYTSPGIGLALLPTFVQEVGVAAAFLTRERSRDSIRTPVARAAAYTGSFIVLVFLQIAQFVNPSWMRPTAIELLLILGGTLWMAGLAFSLTSLWWLRRSFSIEPAARRLVTDGPYRFARHPVYTGYVIYYLGTLCIYPSAAYALTLLIWCAATATRVRYEEAVLRRAFPEEYGAYSQRVGLVAPLLRPERVSHPMNQVV